MLSTENNTSDPSSSCKLSELRSDERASDELALEEADLPNSGLEDNQFCNFSIRDYVCSARSKDIGSNWPFPHQYLRLCLNHGIKDPLPPFEPPDLVRNPFFRKGLASDKLVSCVDSRKCEVGFDTFERENGNYLNGVSCRPIEPLVQSSSDKDQSPLKDREKFTVGSTDSYLCTLSRSVSLNQATSVEERIARSQLEKELIPTNTSHKTSKSLEISGKKCRVLVKIGAISDSSCREDITSNISTVSETMASKTCPVCKTFSSTSNTTLNAHIDQCLAIESDSKWAVDSKLINHRVKPRKIRSMVDIYKTAPRCTLEELDRRNGSNWVLELSLPTPQGEICGEEKRQRISNIDLEETGHDGAVYIDSNGTKVRIISKLDNAPVPIVEENMRPRKYMKNGKERKIISTHKKRHLAPKHSKYLKFKVQRKKLLSLNLDKSEIDGKQNHGAPEGKFGTRENHEKKVSLSPLLKACKQMKPNESEPIRQRLCSERTGLSKKYYNSKDTLQGRGYPTPVTRDPFVQTHQDQPNIDKSSVERTMVMKIPRSSRNHVFQESKRMESELHGAEIVENVEKSPTPENSLDHFNDSMLKPSKFSGSSFPKTKRIEVHASAVRKYGTLGNKTAVPSKGSQNFSQKGKKGETQKSDSSKNVSSSQTDNFVSKSDDLKSASREFSSNGDTVTELSPWKVFGVPNCKHNPSDTLFNPLRSIEEHSKCVYETESWMGPTEPNSSDDQDEVCNDIIGDSADMEIQLDCRIGGGKSFSEFDPIPIPGPPGSFLPNFGDINSEVLQENSSLTSSMVVSSQDQHVRAYRDSSGSPISANSNMSYSPLTRSDLRYSEMESSIEHSTVQDKFVSSFSDGTMKSVIGEAEQFKCRENIERDEGFKTDNLIFPAKGSADFTAEQPCCCSRKISCNPNIKPEIFTTFSTCPRLRIDEVVPVLELPARTISERSCNGEVNCPSNVHLDSPNPSSHSHSQSTSNPVLRLMGKNLMVVNKGEDEYMQLDPLSPSPSHPDAKFTKLLGSSNGDTQIQDYQYNPHNVCFSNGFRSYSNSKSDPIPSNRPDRNCQNRYMGDFAGSSQKHGLSGRNDSQIQQKSINCKSIPPLQYQNALSSAQAAIDGFPEEESDSSMKNEKYAEELKGSSLLAFDRLPPPTGMNFKPRQVNTYSCHQSKNPFLLGAIDEIQAQFPSFMSWRNGRKSCESRRYS